MEAQIKQHFQTWGVPELINNQYVINAINNSGRNASSVALGIIGLNQVDPNLIDEANLSILVQAGRNAASLHTGVNHLKGLIGLDKKAIEYLSFPLAVNNRLKTLGEQKTNVEKGLTVTDLIGFERFPTTLPEIEREIAELSNPKAQIEKIKSHSARISELLNSLDVLKSFVTISSSGHIMRYAEELAKTYVSSPDVKISSELLDKAYTKSAQEYNAAISPKGTPVRFNRAQEDGGGRAKIGLAPITRRPLKPDNRR